ncbi:signal peptidase I [Coprococcus eutactus]|uniref:Signal peptidase I n=1 Tax=Coprococcus eutactus TaxID=33043 RepID=A0A3R5ZYT2_9FIRM|nr:signal peptidase I [Coprococcus eutactus]
MSEDTNKETNVADTLNEIFDDDPAKKAREREIAKYEKKRQKALEKETRKAAKAEAKQKKKNGGSEENTEVSQLGIDKSAEGQASGVSGWSWDQAVKESSENQTETDQNKNNNESSESAETPNKNESEKTENKADTSSKNESDVQAVYSEDGELDEKALRSKLRAEKKAEKKQRKAQKKEDKEINIVKDLLFLCMYILIVIGICWAVLTYVGQRTEVSGESMSNTLHSGDTLWIDKLEYEFGSPKRFDVVVFPYEEEKDTFYIKRIIGLPGETVYIDEEGTIYINDEPLEGDKYGREPIAEDKRGVASEEVTLGDDEYFVLGDNRNNSRDSRFEDVGNIHKDVIIGRAVFRFTGGLGKIE